MARLRRATDLAGSSTLTEDTRAIPTYGETVGFRTAIQRFPDDRLTVIVFANRADLDAPAMAESVAGAVLGKAFDRRRWPHRAIELRSPTPISFVKLNPTSL